MNDNRPRVALVLEEVPVDRRRAGQETVRRRVFAELFIGVALMLASHDQRPVLLERTLVDELLDVLPRHPVAAAATLGDSDWPILVQCVGVSVVVLLQIRADEIRVDQLAAADSFNRDLGLQDEDQREALPDHVADRAGQRLDDPVAVGLDHVLHLHRFHRDKVLTLTHFLSLFDHDRDDCALDRGGQTDGAFWSGQVGRFFLDDRERLFLLDSLVVLEQRERVARVNARAGETGIGRGRLGREVSNPLSAVRLGQFSHLFVDPTGMHTALGQILVLQHIGEEGDVGCDAFNPELG